MLAEANGSFSTSETLLVYIRHIIRMEIEVFLCLRSENCLFF